MKRHSDVIMDRKHSDLDLSPDGDSKRSRTAFTSAQLLGLEREFVSNMYLTRLRRIQIANYLQLSEKQVRTNNYFSHSIAYDFKLTLILIRSYMNIFIIALHYYLSVRR